MKRLLLATISIFLLSTSLSADYQHPNRRRQYEKARMEVITSLAKFTQEEQEFVQKELTKFDNERYSSWEESWKIRQELHALGEDVTEEQYRESLEQLLKLDDRRHEAKTKLFKELNKKLTPKQSYSVYMGIKGNNARTGRNLREE